MREHTMVPDPLLALKGGLTTAGRFKPDRYCFAFWSNEKIEVTLDRLYRDGRDFEDLDRNDQAFLRDLNAWSQDQDILNRINTPPAPKKPLLGYCRPWIAFAGLGGIAIATLYDAGITPEGILTAGVITAFFYWLLWHK